jgi:pentalenene synthase/avermitilol synthase
VQFDVPFVARLNPAVPGAVSRHLAWLERFRLLPRAGAVDEYLDWRFPDLTARWFPAAVGRDLDLILDAYAWMVVLDGQWDSPVGRDPVVVRDAVDNLMSVVRGSRYRSCAAADALADIWNRQGEGMSGPWRERAAGNWERFFASVVEEAVNRRVGAVPTEAEYRNNRDTTGYMWILLDFTERLRHYEVPEVVREAPEFQGLIRSYIWAHNVIQDLFSFEREAVQGDVHNIVFVFEHHRRISRAAAIDLAVSVVREEFKAFVAAEAALPAALDRLRVPLGERAGLYEVIDDLRTTFNATYTWCGSTSRYRSTATTPEGQPGFLGDVLS